VGALDALLLCEYYITRLAVHTNTIYEGGERGEGSKRVACTPVPITKNDICFVRDENCVEFS